MKPLAKVGKYHSIVSAITLHYVSTDFATNCGSDDVFEMRKANRGVACRHYAERKKQRTLVANSVPYDHARRPCRYRPMMAKAEKRVKACQLPSLKVELLFDLRELR
ncbi:hypothetical protein M514_13936 [Trichuris suis]|uniref:Uncharacterized protein n=1 Tax=Trichuris suis TaxID=68888 RepID=A0A085NCI7_9BILA|nr:hypothetical protein M514_13936 [Trichuris suis]